MAEIILANNRGIALIDDEDVARLPTMRWWLQPHGYAAAHTPMVGGVRRTVLLHRIILDPDDGFDVDHVNHNKLDCRRANLRTVTRPQNMQNRAGPTVRNKLGARGVVAYQTKQGCRFRAGVTVHGRNVCRYGFVTVEDAARAASDLRAQYFTHCREQG